MSTTYQPIGNTVLVQAVPVSKTITLPTGFIIGTSKCTIVAIGDGDKIPSCIHVGDTVIASNDGFSLQLENNQQLVNSDNIVAKVIES